MMFKKIKETYYALMKAQDPKWVEKKMRKDRILATSKLGDIAKMMMKSLYPEAFKKDERELVEFIIGEDDYDPNFRTQDDRYIDNCIMLAKHSVDKKYWKKGFALSKDLDWEIIDNRYNLILIARKKADEDQNQDKG